MKLSPPLFRAFPVLLPLRVACLLMLLAASGLFLIWPTVAGAAPPATRAGDQQEGGPGWSELSSAQKTALAPLQGEWRGLEARRKEKWLEVAQRMATMAPDERRRVQARMADWARMTPEQREKARAQFQEAKGIAPDERAARWKAYQSLPPEEKQRLARRADAEAAGSPQRPAGSQADPASKSNLTPNPSFAPPPRPVGSTVVQAQPGATTTLISNRPQPPAHQQTGLPKIAATPEFIDPATLLPRRGAQGAASQRPAPRPAQKP